MTYTMLLHMLLLSEPLREMGAFESMKSQELGNSSGPVPEVVEKQRVAKERAAQRLRSRGPEASVRRRCMKDSRFCQS